MKADSPSHVLRQISAVKCPNCPAEGSVAQTTALQRHMKERLNELVNYIHSFNKDVGLFFFFLLRIRIVHQE